MVNTLARRGALTPGSELFGKAFENWIFHELTAASHYRERYMELSYWRLASGIEVDFIVGDMRCAIEAKAASRVTSDHLKGLRQLAVDQPGVRRRVVASLEPSPRIDRGRDRDPALARVSRPALERGVLGRMSAAGAGGKVAAVIVHYRTPAETTAAAAAVASTAPEAEIVVVDNASGDRVGEALALAAPGARLVTESVNRGYGAACNRGARETSRPYLLFLNSDAVVRPGAIAALAGRPRPRRGTGGGGPAPSQRGRVGRRLRSEGCRPRGGSSARAPASRFSRAAARRSRVTPPPARTMRGRAKSRP